MMKPVRFLIGPILTGVFIGFALLLWQQLTPGTTDSLWPLRSENALLPVRSYSHAVQRAAPAVVNIYTTQLVAQQMPDEPLFNEYMEAPRRERVLSSLGSGVIVSNSGDILTSYHVIRDADEILVALADGRDAVAKVIGIDPETDLALLKIELDDLPVIPMADAHSTHVGDIALAIGNPLGIGQTVSMGIVSATGRSHLGIATFENFIQTDAAINQGNSGGALVDTNGNLIGINTAILSDDGNWQGIGFATPVSIAATVMADLQQYGKVIRGWLGVTVQDITPELATSFQLPEVRGGIVASIMRGSPAHLSGLQPGDVLIGVNGQPIQDGYEAMNMVAGTRPGSKMMFEVIRNRQHLQIETIIGTRPQTVQ